MACFAEKMGLIGKNNGISRGKNGVFQGREQFFAGWKGVAGGA